MLLFSLSTVSLYYGKEVSPAVQVQAHVAQTEVDPGAAVLWLQPSEKGMQAPPAGTQVIRSLVSPAFDFTCSLCKLPGALKATPPTACARCVFEAACCKLLVTAGQRV